MIELRTWHKLKNCWILFPAQPDLNNFKLKCNIIKIKHIQGSFYIFQKFEYFSQGNPCHKFFCSTYHVLQLFWMTAPGWYVLSSCTHGHMAMGTHWLWWSCASPGGHWQPGTHILRPPPPQSSQLQLCRRSEHEAPHARPHSWYTWPPEHWTAGEKAEEERF